MTNTHPLTKASAGLLSAGAILLVCSCQPTSPQSFADKFAHAQAVTISGYNGRETVSSRVYSDWGTIPSNARRAITNYLKRAEWQTADYVRPQYFVQVDKSFWAICIDNAGNLTGIVPFRQGGDARTMQAFGPYKMLVNKTDEGAALGYAILKDLAYADGLRAHTRTVEGLTTPIPTPPAPKATPAPATKAEAAKEATKEETKASKADAADDFGNDDLGDDNSSSDEEDSTSSSDDSSSDDLGDDSSSTSDVDI
jgi:hypothetical protein